MIIIENYSTVVTLVLFPSLLIENSIAKFGLTTEDLNVLFKQVTFLTLWCSCVVGEINFRKLGFAYGKQLICQEDSEANRT